MRELGESLVRASFIACKFITRKVRNPFITIRVYDRALLLAKAARIKGQKNVFLYRWNAPDTVLYNANPHLGAMHTSDLYYLFEGTCSFLISKRH